jgi:hypothetical protein
VCPFKNKIYSRSKAAKINGSETLLQAIREIHTNDAFFYLPDPTDPEQPEKAPKPAPETHGIYEVILRKLIDGKTNQEIGLEICYGLSNVERMRRIRRGASWTGRRGMNTRNAVLFPPNDAHRPQATDICPKYRP